jgi:hypothetical protein
MNALIVVSNTYYVVCGHWLLLAERYFRNDNLCVAKIKYVIYTYIYIYFKIRASHIPTLLIYLYGKVDILLACRKHLHDCTISPRREVWTHKTSLTPPLLLKCLYQTRKISGLPLFPQLIYWIMKLLRQCDIFFFDFILFLHNIDYPWFTSTYVFVPITAKIRSIPPTMRCPLHKFICGNVPDEGIPERCCAH